MADIGIPLPTPKAYLETRLPAPRNLAYIAGIVLANPLANGVSVE
ncbi:hypothetical protein [Rhizobium leguminosarum]|nr:hypothetical protein [Rhizobium leguminosarum]